MTSCFKCKSCNLPISDYQIMEFLLGDDRVEKDMQNEYGWTAKDIFKKNNKNGKTKNTEMSITLSNAKAKLLSSKKLKKKAEKEKRTSWFSDQRNSLMVVASLVATMAFQAALTPPFKDDETDDIVKSLYKQFRLANLIGMVSSMSSIILLISGLPGRRFFVFLTMVSMWVAVSSITYTYGLLLGVSARKYNLDDDYYNITGKFGIVVVLWAFGMALIILPRHLIKWTWKLLKRFLAALAD